MQQPKSVLVWQKNKKPKKTNIHPLISNEYVGVKPQSSPYQCALPNAEQVYPLTQTLWHQIASSPQKVLRAFKTLGIVNVLAIMRFKEKMDSFVQKKL